MYSGSPLSGSIQVAIEDPSVIGPDAVYGEYSFALK